MFKYTLATCQMISDDLKRTAHIAKIAVPLAMVLYLVLQCFIGAGILILNILLALVTAAGVITYVITASKISKDIILAGNKVTHTLKIIKIVLDCLSLAVTLYSISTGAAENNALKIVIAPFLIISLLFQILSEFISWYVNAKITLFVDGIQMDLEPVMKAAVAPHNLLCRITGREEVDVNYVSDRNRKAITAYAEKSKKKK